MILRQTYLHERLDQLVNAERALAVRVPKQEQVFGNLNLLFLLAAHLLDVGTAFNLLLL